MQKPSMFPLIHTLASISSESRTKQSQKVNQNFIAPFVTSLHPQVQVYFLMLRIFPFQTSSLPRQFDDLYSLALCKSFQSHPW